MPAKKKKAAAKRSAAKKPSVAPASERIGPILRKLYAMYPDAECALHHSSALELLVATILSAQCTDARVNMVTPHLFKTYPSAAAYAAAKPSKLEDEIKTTGFFRNKTKSIQGMAVALEERHGGEVPHTMDELVKLPGVGRKTANVILGTWFKQNEGVVVDTHVARVSARLGFTKQTDPVKIEQDLMKIVPRDEWTKYSHTIIHHGRQICGALRPKCEICPVLELCPFGIKTKGRESRGGAKGTGSAKSRSKGRSAA